MTADLLDELGALDVQDPDGDPSGIPAEDLSSATEVEEADDGTADPAVVERELCLERLRDYCELLQKAVRTADRDSLARAADLAALYADTAWVLDMPTPKRTSLRGRPVDPKSRSVSPPGPGSARGWQRARFTSSSGPTRSSRIVYAARKQCRPVSGLCVR